MITTSNINKAIVTRLQDLNIVMTKDIKNPVPPCLYVDYIASNNTEIANETNQIRYSFGIYYFSDKNTLLDLTQKEIELKKAFKKPLRVEYKDDKENVLNRFLKISSLEIDLNEDDYILNCIINFDFIESEIDENPYNHDYYNEEIMEDLELDLENN